MSIYTLFNSFVKEYEWLIITIIYISTLLLLYFVFYEPDTVINGILMSKYECFTGFSSRGLANKAQHGFDSFTGFNSNTLMQKAYPGVDNFTGFNSNTLMQKAYPGVDSFTGFNSNTLMQKTYPGVDSFTGFNSNTLMQKAYPGVDSFTGFNSNTLMQKAYPGVEPFTSAVLYRLTSNVPIPDNMLKPNYSTQTLNSNMLEQEIRN